MKYLLISVALLTCGCTTGTRIGDNDQAWYAETQYILFIPMTHLYYCKADKTDVAADPKCFEAKKYDVKRQVGIVK